MDGYTVDEAASVLGVPQARVWELLARGVLAGAPEGETGMRVFLKGGGREEVTNRPERAEPGRGSNGNGGGNASDGGEMSPFRELLTEFRNLTERYGQALLALGEARGEVASLRSRVELLEARIDLRLPASRPASTVAWEMPDYAAPSRSAQTDAEAEPAVETETATEPEGAPGAPTEELTTAEGAAVEAPGAQVLAEEVLAVEAGPEEWQEEAREESLEAAAEETTFGQAPVVPTDRATSRRKRLHPGREAISGLAEALARAQDPTLADLPGAREAAEAMAELRREIDAGSVAERPTAVEEPHGDTPEAPEAEPLQVGAGAEPMAATAIPLDEIALEEPQPEEAVAVEGEILPVGEEPLPAEAVAFEEEILRGGEEPLSEEAVAFQDEILRVGEEQPEEAVAFQEEILRGGEEQPEETVALEEEILPAGEEPQPEETAAFAEGVAASVVPPEGPPAPEEAQPPPAAEAPIVAPAAEPPQPSHYSTDVVEPDWFADGDFTWLEAAEAERTGAEAGDHGQAEVVQADETPTAALQTPQASMAEGDAESDEPSALAVEPFETELPETELPAAELPADELPAAGLEERVEEPGESVADVAVAEGAPAALIDEAWNEPVGEPAWAEPVSAEPASAEPASAELAWAEPAAAPQAVAALAPEAEVHPEPEEAEAPAEVPVSDIGDEWPEAEAPLLMPPAIAAPEPMPEVTSSPTPPVGDALGGFRAASAEELGQPPPGLPRAALQPPGEEELMWLGDEFEAAGLEVAAQGWRGEARSVEEEAAKPPVFELSDEELARLAKDEGWNIDEVNAIRAFLARPDEDAGQPSVPTHDQEPAVEAVMAEAAPPADELPVGVPAEGEQPQPEADVAESAPAVEAAVPAPTERAAEPQEASPPSPPEPPADEPLPEAPAAASEAPDVTTAPAAQPPTQPPRPLPAQPDPDWLRGRRGPAATAYRRLRRLFPG